VRSEKKEERRLKMKALIIAAEGVEDLEFYYPFFRLLEEGIAVDVAGIEPGTVHGKTGYPVKIGLSVKDVKVEEYGLLVIPGGKAPENLRTNYEAVQLVNKCSSKAMVIAAICHGPQLLISANLLKGKNVTCYKSVKDDVIAAGAKYIDQEVVIDGKLITSRTPEDLPAFCREIIRAIK
jgi:protease I